MSFTHVLYVVKESEDGVVYKCGSCDRQVVHVLKCKEGPTWVTITEGMSNIEHERLDPIEPFEFPQEFEELFTKKGWA